jgi:hypothetical protein
MVVRLWTNRNVRSGPRLLRYHATLSSKLLLCRPSRVSKSGIQIRLNYMEADLQDLPGTDLIGPTQARSLFYFTPSRVAVTGWKVRRNDFGLSLDAPEGIVK